MKKTFSHFFLLLTVAISCVSFTACFYKNPVTGRSSLDLVDDGTMLSLSNQQYATFLSANPAVQASPDAEMVKRVGGRLSVAVAKYLAQIGHSDLIKGYQWEFNLVNKSEANAWCMPGGKIVVYTGILPLTQNEAALAAVLGHEIAHAVLKHGNERMSEQLLQQYGGAALSVMVSGKPAETQQLFNAVYGVSSTLGVLAYSRKQETEADENGLYFMAMAGYNPNEAISFWQRMAAQGGAKQPELLSSHPDNAQRISDIKKAMPKAMSYYHP
jgi:predicted Zn-dependent protease